MAQPSRVKIKYEITPFDPFANKGELIDLLTDDEEEAAGVRKPKDTFLNRYSSTKSSKKTSSGQQQQSKTTNNRITKASMAPHSRPADTASRILSKRLTSKPAEPGNEKLQAQMQTWWGDMVTKVRDKEPGSKIDRREAGPDKPALKDEDEESQAYAPPPFYVEGKFSGVDVV